MSDNPLLVKPRESVVLLYPGDAEPELEKIQEQLDEAYANEGGGRRMSGPPSEADALAAQLDERAAEVKAQAVTVRLRAVSDRTARQIQDNCPKREGNSTDDLFGYNPDEFWGRMVRAMLVDPVVTDEQWDEFRESVSSWNWSKLVGEARELHEGEVSLPKSSAVSALRQMRGADRTRSAPTE